MAQVRDDDHITVSIYPFTDDEVDLLMNSAQECVVMWATKDGWPVGVIHSFVWAEGKIWISFSAHRHRAHAIRRDPRVSVSVSQKILIYVEKSCVLNGFISSEDPSVHDKGSSTDIGRRCRGKKEDHPRHLIRLCCPS